VEDLADGNAEKIKGRWIGGKTPLARGQIPELYKESEKLLGQRQTAPAVKKARRGSQRYPNDFEMDFTLGYLYTVQA